MKKRKEKVDDMRIFSGNSNVPLAKEICDILGISLGQADVRNFSDGEIQVDIDESVRGMDVFVVQSTCTPGNTNLMELLIMIDALKRASANRITAVLPYYGYARQDRKVSPRVPITAKLVADLITTAGANRVLTMDLHAGQIQGFFNIPVDHLFAAPVLLEHIRSRYQDDMVIVSPDAGGVERARAFGKRLKAGLAIIDKRREGPNVAKFMNIIGEVKGSAGRHSRRYGGHRRDLGRGGDGSAIEGRVRSRRLLHPSGSFRAGRAAHPGFHHPGDCDDQHDPAETGSVVPSQVQSFVRGQPAGRSDQENSL